MWRPLLPPQFPIKICIYFLFTSLHFSVEISTFSLLFYWNLYFLLTSLLKPLLRFHFSIEFFTFWSLSYWNLYFLSIFYWNLYFLITLLFKSLLFLNFSIDFPVDIDTFWSLSYWNLYFFFFSIEISTFCHFLITFLLKFLPSDHVPIEIFALSAHFPLETPIYLFAFLITFLLKSLSDHFPIEISTFWSFSYWKLNLLFTFLLKPPLSVTFWSLSYCNFYFLITFLLKSLLSVTFCALSSWNLHFWILSVSLTTFLLKSLSDNFPIEISTFSSLFY